MLLLIALTTQDRATVPNATECLVIFIYITFCCYTFFHSSFITSLNGPRFDIRSAPRVGPVERIPCLLIPGLKSLRGLDRKFDVDPNENFVWDVEVFASLRTSTSRVATHRENSMFANPASVRDSKKSINSKLHFASGVLGSTARFECRSTSRPDLVERIPCLLIPNLVQDKI